MDDGYTVSWPPPPRPPHNPYLSDQRPWPHLQGYGSIAAAGDLWHKLQQRREERVVTAPPVSFSAESSQSCEVRHTPARTDPTSPVSKVIETMIARRGPTAWIML